MTHGGWTLRVWLVTALVVVLAGCSAGGTTPDEPVEGATESQAAVEPVASPRSRARLVNPLDAVAARDIYAQQVAASGDPAFAIKSAATARTARGGGVVSEFLTDRIRVAPASTDRAAQLRLSRLGCGDTLAEVAPPSTANVLDNRIEYDRGLLTEWYVNGPLGIEQGFTLHGPLADPACAAGDLTLEIEVSGALTPERARSGSQVTLSDADGNAVLRYSHLHAEDAAGQPLPTTLDASGLHITLQVDLTGAEFPVRVDPLVATLARELTRSGTTAFGSCVGIDGGLAVVGDYSSFGQTGLAYTYARNGSAWSPDQTLAPAGANYFGISCDISGTTIALGANNTLRSTDRVGAVYVFGGGVGSWFQQQMLQPTELDDGDQFGRDISLDGDLLAVTATGDDDAAADAGAVYMFARSGGTWSLEQKITAVGSYLVGTGMVVSLSGNTLAVGVPNDGGGMAYVYVRNGTVWSQQQSWTGQALQALGTDISVDGDTLAISSGAAAEWVDIYTRTGTTWNWQHNIDLSTTLSVAVSGDSLILGDGGYSSNRGRAHLYQRSGTTWDSGTPFTPGTLGTNSYFGNVLSLRGRDLILGVPSAQGVSFPDYGRAFIYRLLATDGTPCTAGDDCESGFCADGFCCNSECQWECESCDGSLTVNGVDGVCDRIVAGTDPFDDCTDDGSPGCGQNGLCDGFWSCQNYPVASGCTPEPCTTGSECTSGNCVDGICCNNSCNTLCRACTATLKGGGLDGVCEPIADGADPQSECGIMGAGACQGDGVCNGASGCRSSLSGQVCAAQSCSDAYTQQNTDYCNASGTCIDGGSTGCGTYLCQSSACLTSCVTSNDCNPSFECLGGACGTGASLGEPCLDDVDCSSLHCAENVCCDTACTGGCNSCLAANKANGVDTGTCGVIRAGADPKSACAPDGTQCGADGSCDGAGACQLFAVSTTPCDGGSVCVNQTSTAVRHCDGAGACVSDASTPCTPYICSGATGACLLSCNASPDCAPGYFCQSSVCIPTYANGTGCSTNDQCALGNCVEGVCCNTACGGGCESCLASNKESGTDTGTCGPIRAGADPKTACTDSGTECGADGTCDGAGACRLFAPDTTSCDTGTTCISQTEMAGRHCDGAGACVSTSATPCNPYICAAASGSCLQTCTSANDCAPGYFCQSSACLQAYPNGTGCTANDQCASSSCVEGVCCDLPCGGGCQSCLASNKGSGADGVCGAVAAGSDPLSACAPSPTNECGADGSCDGQGACRTAAPSGAPCEGGSVCSTSTVSDARACDGAGSCATASSTSCVPYLCTAVTGNCQQSCNLSSDCAASYYCANSACEAQGANGVTCTDATHCASGFCVDGVCCDEACDGTCRSCTGNNTVAGVDGVCDVVVDGLDPRSDCDRGSTPCGADGQCDGAGDCRAFAASGTACGADTCDTASMLSYACDGFGTCNESSDSCAPYACNAGGTGCRADCTTDADCATGAQCNTQTSQCAVTTATCSDAYTVELPDGSQTSCAPYECETGACLDSCSAASDCMDGYTCEASACVETPDPGTGGSAGSGTGGSTTAGSGGTDSGGTSGSGTGGGGNASSGAGGEPTAPGAAASDEAGGCGCRAAGSPRTTGAWWLAAAVGLAFARRRRRPAARRW